MFCSNEELITFLQTDGNRLIAAVWKTYGGKDISFADYQQEAYRIIAQSLARYDQTKASKTTYIYTGLCNVLKVMRRRRSALCRQADTLSISIEDMQGIEVSDPTTDVEGQVIDNLDRQRRSEKLWRAIRAAELDADEMTAIQLTLQDLTQQEVADLMGVKQPKVSKLLTMAIRKIRCALRVSGWDEPGYDLDSMPESVFSICEK